jgi:hypothetical protein
LARKEARKAWALTERPACFEIAPQGRAVKRVQRYGCRMQLITASNGGTISSSRCQTACTTQPKLRGQIQAHGRAHKSRKRDDLSIMTIEVFARSTVPLPKLGGARRDRTDDLLLAKQALSQLSYGPVEGVRTSSKHRDDRCARDAALERVVGLGRLELPTSRLSSARSNQLSYKPPKP